MTAEEKATFDRFKIDWLTIRDLSPHPKVQRPYREAWAKDIGANFDPDKFRPLDVVPSRTPGKYWVFAGQHRLGGARIALGEDQKIPCHVHEDMPLEKQAAVCLGVDDMLRWTNIDEWRLRSMAKEDGVVEIEKVVASHGLRIERTAGPDKVRAVAALEAVYNLGGVGVLDSALSILKAAYGLDKDTFDGTLIKATGLVVAHFGTNLDHQELSTKLSRHSTPRRMLAMAKDWSTLQRISMTRATADRIINVYNGRSRLGRLSFEKRGSKADK